MKIPERILHRIPAAGRGRSGFILQALEEKLSAQSIKEWKPATERGRKMAKIISKGRAEGVQMLNDAQFIEEFRQRRGRNA